MHKLLGALEFYIEDGIFYCKPKCVGKGISSGFFIDETIPFKSIESAEEILKGRLLIELEILLRHARTNIEEIITIDKKGF